MNIMAHLPAIKPEIATRTALTPLRSVDTHSLPHLKMSKAARAVLGADILDGGVRLDGLTAPIVAKAVGVSVSSIGKARRLPWAQRDEVRKGMRPLALPKPELVPLPLLSPAVAGAVPSAEQRLMAAAKEMGLTEALEVLVKVELASAA
jgi:hypothetical protein